MKWIHLKKEFYCCVDIEDYHIVSQHLWRYHLNGYARNQEDHFLHHLLLGLPPKHLCVDHINRAPWDNRRSNLRIATRSLNSKNSGIPIDAPYPSLNEMKIAKEERVLLKKKRDKCSIAAKRNKNWKACERPVYNDLGEIFESVKKASLKYPSCCRNIQKVIKGERKTCSGRMWFYLD